MTLNLPGMVPHLFQEPPVYPQAPAQTTI